MSILEWVSLIGSASFFLTSLGYYLRARTMDRSSMIVWEEWRLKLIAFERIITSCAAIMSEMKDHRKGKPPKNSQSGAD